MAAREDSLLSPILRTVTASGWPGGHWQHDEAAKLILKTRPEMHTKHCVLEKYSLNPLRFAK